jgi:hypothetical protein
MRGFYQSCLEMCRKLCLQRLSDVSSWQFFWSEVLWSRLIVCVIIFPCAVLFLEISVQYCVPEKEVRYNSSACLFLHYLNSTFRRSGSGKVQFRTMKWHNFISACVAEHVIEKFTVMHACRFFFFRMDTSLWLQIINYIFFQVLVFQDTYL